MGCPIPFDVSIVGQKVELYAMLNSVVVNNGTCNSNSNPGLGLLGHPERNYAKLYGALHYAERAFLMKFEPKSLQSGTSEEIYCPLPDNDDEDRLFGSERRVMSQFRDIITRCVAADYFSWFYTTNPTESDSLQLGNFVSIVNNWNELSGCSLGISGIDSRGDTDFHDIRVKRGFELFQKSLDKDNETFVYSVGPSDLFQRVSATTQVQLARSVGFDVAAGATS